MNTTVRVYRRTCRNCGAAFTGLAQSRFCPGCRAPRCQSCGCAVSRSNRSERPRLLCGPCAVAARAGPEGGCPLGHPRLLPCEPTSARPGSPEKARILEARFAAGQELWNAADVGAGDE